MTECQYCGEPILPDEEIGFENQLHRECAFRAVAGSVAHILCRCSCHVMGSTEGDPLGMTKREGAKAALQVWNECQKWIEQLS